MGYDLVNNNVKVDGSYRVIDFNIISESMESGRRLLTMVGFDYEGGYYTATGWFDKCTYILHVNTIERKPKNYILMEDGLDILLETGQILVTE